MLGIDIIEIERIRKAAENPRFLERLFTPSELEYYKSNGSRAETLAGVFAAKEAVIKALDAKTLPFNRIEIAHTAAGKPYAVVNGKTLQISISHNKTDAVAVATE